MNELTKEDFIQVNTMLNIQEVLRLIGVSRRTLYHMIEEKNFPSPYKITNSRIAWKKAQIMEWLSNLKYAEYKGSE